MPEIKKPRIVWRRHSDGNKYPYYQRHYPAHIKWMLQELGKGGKIVRRLEGVSHDCTETELLVARDKFDRHWEDMCAGWERANLKEMTAIQAQKSALAYLEMHGIALGSARRLQTSERIRLQISFDTTLQEEVAQEAWRLVTEEPQDFEQALLVSDAFDRYKRTCEPRYARVLDKFLTATGDRELTTKLNKIVTRYSSEQLETRGWATVKKDQAIILAALNTTLKREGFDFTIRGYSFQNTGSKKEYTHETKDVFSKEQLRELFSRDLADIDRWTLMLCLCAGAINNEVYKVATSDNAIQTLEGCPLVRFPRGKTEARERAVPILWLPPKPPITFGERRLRDRLTNLCKSINPNASPYSLRHSTEHYLKMQSVTDADRAAICGWAHQGRFHDYGEAGKFFPDRLTPLIEVQRRAFGWLFDEA